jgi:hypothetical protein
MKRNLLLRSFWNADVSMDWVLLEQYNLWEFENKTFVEKTQILIDDFVKYQKQIQFHMVNSFLEQYWTENTVYDFIWVFTKQNNEYAITDTYNLLFLFKKYIENKIFTDKNISISLQDYKHQIILNDIYDEEKIHDIFMLSLSKFDDDLNLSEYNNIYRNITWWTKIMWLILMNTIKQIFWTDLIQLCYALWNKKENKSEFKLLKSELVLS